MARVDGLMSLFQTLRQCSRLPHRAALRVTMRVRTFAERALLGAELLRERGVLTSVFVHPTVGREVSLVRFSVHAGLDAADIRAAKDVAASYAAFGFARRAPL
jgi:7-keto-8-aminopelargonate synthetase-like enzyme